MKVVLAAAGVYAFICGAELIIGVIADEYLARRGR